MVKKLNRRIESLFMALILGVSLMSGCGANSSGNNDSGESTAADVTEEDVDMEAFYAHHGSGLDPEEGDVEPQPEGDYEIDDRSNYRLVDHTRISPNRDSPRRHKIDTITIHCMAGQLSVETCGNAFASRNSQASSNYGIGRDGRIAMYVEEKDRSWCSSDTANDHRAITIEVASDPTSPYAVNDVAYRSLIKLVTDICKRNGIKKLVWSTDRNQRINHQNGANMTVHSDFANVDCPGDYLYSRMGDIADSVNKNLGAK